MSVLRRAFEQRSLDTIDTPGKWKQGMVWEPWAGYTGNADQSMRLSAVFACLRILSEAIASLPLDTFQRDGEQRRPYPKPAYLTFGAAGRVNYLSQVMLSLLTNGNAYIVTPRDGLGVPLNLVPLDPCRVSVTQAHVGAPVEYRVDGHLMGPFDLMHISGMMMPGALKGVSPIGYAAETIELGLAAQRFGTAFFANGALPGAVIETPGKFDQAAAERFTDSWYAKHGGIANANRVGVLTGGAVLKKVSIQPNEAQFLETRQFQVPDIARIFGVPPHLIADASNSTSWGSGLAEQNQAFGTFSLRPWVTRIEEAHDRLLGSHAERDTFVKLNMDALLRPSQTDRFANHAVGITSRFLTPNEARRIEDLPPLPGGDQFHEVPVPESRGSTQ